MGDEKILKRLKSMFSYDKDSGEFTRIVSVGGMRAGSKAGTVYKNGYVRISVDGKVYAAHRLAWLYVNGEFPVCGIDHINGVKTDNRMANLRVAGQQENMQNVRKAKSHSKSGLLGVYKSRNKWAAQITVNKVKRFLGVYETPEAAHCAYMAEKEMFHPFAPRQAN